MPTEIEGNVCRWTTEADALREFAEFSGKTQSASHIKPLHWYVACRLVIEEASIQSTSRRDRHFG